MAELAVRVHYLNPARSAALTALRFTFPLWGVLSPITAACMAIGYYFQSIHGTVDPHSNAFMLSAFSFLLIFVSGLITLNWLNHDAVQIDKDGIRLPFAPLGKNEIIRWSQIKKVLVAFDENPDWHHRQLSLITTSGAKPLSLTHINATELEKILLAIEMWKGEDTVIDDSVKALKAAILSDGAAIAGAPGTAGDPLLGALSYTEMWEEELNRRFTPTSFVPLDPGKIIRNGSVKIVRHLALGGLSAVYLGQLEGRKLVVIKEAVVSDDSSASAQAKAREMLDREAAVLLKLSHPNITKVMDYFIEHERNYLMLDYINGQDLRQLVKQNGPVKESLVINWALQMANILKYLHEQDPPMIHRDFTPDNIVLCQDGSVVVIDFGAANEFIGNATGTFVGKHAYISPEQFRGKAVVQSDLYALGCTLHFLLTGLEPEALSTSNPLEHNDQIASELAELVIACTQMEVRDRYQSAAQLVPVLRQMAAVYPANL